MKFLIDHQLPPALKLFFQSKGIEAVHVAEVGMQSESDRVVWAYAKTNSFDLVSKDEDFIYLSSQDQAGPRVIWVRLGNCSNASLVAAFERLWPQLEQWMESSDRLVEVR